MCNLLQEICREIDSMAIHSRTTLHVNEMACVYKSKIKKLLIKYEAKDNPSMKINEIAADLEAFKTNVTNWNVRLEENYLKIDNKLEHTYGYLKTVDVNAEGKFKELEKRIDEMSENIEEMQHYQNIAINDIKNIAGILGGLSSEVDEILIRVEDLEPNEQLDMQYKYNHAINILKRLCMPGTIASESPISLSNKIKAELKELGEAW
jgi:hypothetical protein